MKSYSIPKLKITKFVTEYILTLSGDTQKTAMERAKAAAANVEESQKTFIITF